MSRSSWIGALSVLVSLTGCAIDTGPGEPEEVTGEVAEASGRKCYSSNDCQPNHYCSTEDGDCNSACRPNQPCIAVCAGVCKKSQTAGESCGSVTCPTGTECCNASCGICVEPGGFCTQQLCTSESL